MAKAGEVFGYSPDDPLYDMEVSGVAPQQNIPVTDAIAKGEKEETPTSPYFTKTTDSQETAAIEESVAETVVGEEPQGIELTPDTFVKDPRDGKVKPWKEMEGLYQLKKDTDAEKFQLAREKDDVARQKQVIDQNRPFLDAAMKSPFARTLLNTLSSNDIPEDQAIAAAFAASGRGNPFAQQQQAQVDQDPEPQLPANFDSDNPEHMAVASKHLAWENRQSAKQMAEQIVAPIRQQLDDLQRQRENERIQQDQERARAQRVADHNRQVLGSLPKYVKFDPSTLQPEQARQFWDKFNMSAEQLGVRSDHPLTEAEVAGIAASAFPGGLNPFVAQQASTQSVAAQTKAVIEQAKNTKPLSPGSSGGTPHGGEFPQSESDRIRSLLEGMAVGGN